MNKWNLFFIVILAPTPLYAYLGPGMAGGAIVAAVGFIFAIFLAFGSILYFPIKRALRNRRKKSFEKKKKS